MSVQQQGKGEPVVERGGESVAGAKDRIAIPRGSGAAILRALALGEQNVTALVHATHLSQSNVSNHLARYRRRGLVATRRSGQQILYRLVDANLGRFLLMRGTPGGSQRPMEQVAQDFLEAALTLREEVATAVADAAVAAGVRWPDLYLAVFAPTLVEVGRRWEQGDLDVSTEHYVTAMVLRLMHRLSLSLPTPPEERAPSALIGCVAGEMHTVGGRMVADFLLADGWRIWYLNGNVPASSFLRAASHCQPDNVLLCITCAAHSERLWDTARRLVVQRGARSVPLIVAGGQYFEQPRERVEGADLMSADIRFTVAEMRKRLAGPQEM